MNLVSIVIPILVIVLAVITRKIITSLFLGVFLGGIFLSNGNVLKGLMTGVEYVVKSLSKEDSVYIILFLFLFGSLAEIIKMSGGIKGFVKLAENHVKSERGALGSVWAVTPVTFIDCCFHAISAGTIAKSLTDKINGNKLRLAHVLNVTSCLLIILIPFGTTYVGYIVGVISSSMSNTGIQVSPYKIYLQSIPFNFYAIIMVLFSIVVTVAPFGFNRKYNINALDNESEHEAHEQCTFEEKAPPRPLNLILPLAVLITSTIFFLWYTGRDNTGTFFKAILNANFEKSILFSAVLTILFTSLFYLFQKIPLNEIESHFMIGGNEMIPPIIILILSWGLSAIVLDLGFRDFITQIVGSNLPADFLPAIIFLICCAASYFMGSAWGTWALVMPVALPLATGLNLSIPLMVGAVLAGGSLGDNASPLGETAVLSATISDVPLMEHVKSQLPYSLSAVGLSAVLFIIVSMII